MKNEDYISSGDLELYVLGLLSEEENREIESALSDPKLLAEKQKIEETLEALAMSGSMEPPKVLRDKILDEVSGNSQQKSSQGPGRWLIAASVSAALVSSTLAYVFWNNWQSTEERLTIALLETSQMADRANFTNQKLDQAQETLEILSDPSFQQIAMNGLENTPDHRTFVYWNESTKETYLQIDRLAELSEEEQYQLWSIQDGKPVDAGVFDLTDSFALIKMKENKVPQAFAITIEPKGGSVSPTLDTMVVLGNV